MNKINCIFALFSLICSSVICCFWLPELFEKNDFISRIFKWGYSQISHSLPYPKITYIIFIGLILFLIIWCALEFFWESIDNKPLTSRGSAHWAKTSDIKKLFTNKGVPVGRFEANSNKLIRLDSHIVTCAPTRSGKGIGAIIPALLDYKDSLICLDIKGENYAITARRRSDLSKVYAINPFGVLGIESSSYNWLDSIQLDQTDCIEKAGKISSLLVGRSKGNSAEAHFEEQAIRLLQGVILLVCAESPEKRNMGTVADLIHVASITDLCELMVAQNSKLPDVVAKIGYQFLNNENNKEVGSILSTAQRATNFLDNPNIRKTLEKSDFNILDLPFEAMSIYLIMEQDKIGDFAAYIRIFFDLALSSVIASQGRGKYEVLFILDEVAQLGYMKILVNAVSFVRGFGGQLWFFFQDMGQLKSIYGDDGKSILANSSQIFYGCNDLETAEYISKNLGKKTIKELDSDRKKHNLIARDLLTPDEVKKRKPEYPIILINGYPPISANRLTYYKDKLFKGMFDKNPYFKGER